MKATILDIQRLSTEDGPGLRTTVFFKGCSLACSWCHNPESIRFPAQVQWVEIGRCIGCRLCVQACPQGGLTAGPDGIGIDREKCVACGTCVEACPTGAMERKGYIVEVDELVSELLKDKAYFSDEGGVTFSGGEALMQPQFVEEMLRRMREAGVQTAVDTAGFVPESSLRIALDNADLILYDLKILDPEEHRKYTGQDNGQILENARLMARYIRENGRPKVWIRTPVIPGATDADENIAAISRFIGDNLNDVIERWELCAFNNLCITKYNRLGRKWEFADAQKIPKAGMDHLADVAKAGGADSAKVLWTGATRLETKAG